MNSSPRGLALVISNVTFDACAAPDLDPRKGGEVDDEVLRKVFTELDYVVTVHRDLTAQVTHMHTNGCYYKANTFNILLIYLILMNENKERVNTFYVATLLPYQPVQ